MTEAELYLIDLCLSRAQIGVPFRVHGLLHNATVGIHDKFSEGTVKQIIWSVQNSPDSIRNLLLSLEYTRVVEPSTHQDILDTKGVQAKKEGGHFQYLEWERKKVKKEGFENFPKSKWWIYEPLKWIFFLIVGVMLERYVIKGCNKEKLPDPGKTNVMPISPQQPKSSNGKDSV
jgi:hypothetical protein